VTDDQRDGNGRAWDAKTRALASWLDVLLQMDRERLRGEAERAGLAPDRADSTDEAKRTGT
jgi:hypothetical protein